ncbi:hypothetical protein BaRGS_00027573 [Batillaria attramentaria]|uniref:Uncharacterized protein n=1 Tax=Batillaria attramentaria TaxID=370345 RepID=A0ABD0K2F8_9CAEN
MAPQYAGVIASLAMLGTPGAVVINIMSFFFLGPTGTLEDWQRLFLVTGLVLLAIVIVFDVIASAERQPWSSAAHREFDVTDDDARATVTSTSGETTTCHSEYKSDETPLLSEDVSDVKFGGDCKTKYGVASYRPATQCKEHT